MTTLNIKEYIFPHETHIKAIKIQQTTDTCTLPVVLTVVSPRIKPISELRRGKSPEAP